MVVMSIQWLKDIFPILPIGGILLTYSLIGFVVSFYLIWKGPLKSRFEKVIVWFLRIGTIALSIIITLQIGLLLYDQAPFTSEGWDLVRYNFFHELGWQSANWYFSLYATESAFEHFNST